MRQILSRLVAVSALLLAGCEPTKRVAEATISALKSEIVSALSDDENLAVREVEWSREARSRPAVEPSITRPAASLNLAPSDPLPIATSTSKQPQELVALATGSTLAPNMPADWSFSGANGPENWAALDRTYRLCGAGLHQSPVGLTSPSREELPHLQFHYANVRAAVVNDGRLIYVQPSPGLWLDIAGMRYDLVELQLRSPSEHNLESRPSAMEIQLVHQNIHGQFAVVAVLIEAGAGNPTIEALALAQPTKPDPGDSGPNTSLLEFELNPDGLLPESKEHFRYSGSMTTPPCHEGVAWHVMATPIEAAAADIDKLAENMPPANSRGVQPLNGRLISRSAARH